MILYCTACRQECFTQEIDEGIGTFEFWGCRGRDVRLVTVSDCCDADTTNERPEELEEEGNA